MIISYTYNLKVYGHKSISMKNFKNISTITLLQLLFGTAARPYEILPYSGKNKTNGLKIKDIKFIKHTGQRGKYENYIIIKIQQFKNQISKKIHKKIYLGRTNCGSKSYCNCKIFDPMKLLLIYIKLRKNILQKLQINNESLFIKENGKSITTNDLHKLTKEMISKLQPTNPNRYSSYSLRIGSTTQMAKTRIDMSMIMNYIGWSQNKLPTMAHRYIRYDELTLKNVPYKMVHNENKNQTNYTCDPWRSLMPSNRF